MNVISPMACSPTSRNDYLVSDTIAFTSEAVLTFADIYRVIQKERSIFWEVTVSTIVRKMFIRTCALT